MESGVDIWKRDEECAAHLVKDRPPRNSAADTGRSTLLRVLPVRMPAEYGGAFPKHLLWSSIPERTAPICRARSRRGLRQRPRRGSRREARIHRSEERRVGKDGRAQWS